MDVVFDRYLQRICSNLEATDVKGEPIHQTLMAKKMAKMDESLDFRPFKFRIAAFTNGFMEEHHLGEDVVPQKKVKAYLWHQQPIISRFNEDGKKSKSKGNHVWHIFAKREPETAGWTFRPFERKILGNPTPIAYVGLRWSWQPRIWDPQMSRQSIHVTWGSPSLPGWLSWENDTLVGTPSASDANDVDIVVEAGFPQEDRPSIRTTFHVQVVMFTISDQMMPKSRAQPSVGGNITQARHAVNQTFVPPHHTVDSSTPRPASRDTSDFIGVATEAPRQVAPTQPDVPCSQDYDDTANRPRPLSLAQHQVLADTLTPAVAQELVELARSTLVARADTQMSPDDPAFHDATTLPEGFKPGAVHAVNCGDSVSSEVAVILATQALAREPTQSGYHHEESGNLVNRYHSNIDECQLPSDLVDPFPSDVERLTTPILIHPS
ncbi:uncharacterized protein EI90DRAFT_20390 [Cantharellus anzutake]|uniref:uncharacterized protein n=1 Tax=Cantharellus anzutake TaxID=1750568 RepID=UPI00190473C0|nr:uncharacterized protein EI90DRAFT_20390 [Cantharellus anzutake]KAF8343904.1 hypothetical protein EI90DRAFT_20390 [Cantharellus anzutake]